MKINWKVLIAAVLIVVVSVWAVDSLRSRSYSGVDLNIATGHGLVTVTNPSEASVPIQLTGTGTRAFSVSSTVDGLSGSSTREGSGRTATQLLELALPQGVSTFTVVSSSIVNLVGNSTDRLDVMLQPLNDNEIRSTLIAAGVVILIALFYMSHVTGHRWIKSLRPGRAEVLTAPVVSVGAGAKPQGLPIRSYGDNRADISEK